MKESAPAEIVEFTEPRIIFGSQGEDSLQPLAEKARRFITARLAASLLLDALDLRGRDLEHNEACIMMALQHAALLARSSFLPSRLGGVVPTNVLTPLGALAFVGRPLGASSGACSAHFPRLLTACERAVTNSNKLQAQALPNGPLSDVERRGRVCGIH
jgi:hypothetical protein